MIASNTRFTRAPDTVLTRCLGAIWSCANFLKFASLLLAGLIFFSPFQSGWAGEAETTGGQAEDLTATCMWPSDHAGVFVKLKIPESGN